MDEQLKAEARAKAEAVMLAINKAAKKKVIQFGSVLAPKTFLPSGSLSVDYALGGGWVRGESSMVWGVEGAGKSTLAAITAAAVQRMGGVVAWIDAENRLDRAWLQKNGVDVEALVLVQPEEKADPEKWNPLAAEEVLNLVIAMLKAGGIDLLILDSLAVLVPMKELDNKDGMEGKSYAGISAILSQLQRMVGGSGLLKRSNTHLMFLNQVREKVNSMGYGPKDDYPGGHAIKHMVSQVIKLQRSGYLETPAEVFDPITGRKEKMRYGIEIMGTVQKSSVAPPFRKSRFNILARSGFDGIEEMQVIAVGLGVIQQSGAWFQYAEPETGEVLGRWQGKQKLIDALTEDAGLQEKIRAEVTQMIQEGAKL